MAGTRQAARLCDEADEAGRFPGGTAAKAGSIDERLPMYREGQKRICAELAHRVNEFFRIRPQAAWDFAAPEAIFHEVLNELEPGVRTRIRRALPKDLVHLGPAELVSHFAGADAVVA